MRRLMWIGATVAMLVIATLVIISTFNWPPKYKISCSVDTEFRSLHLSPESYWQGAEELQSEIEKVNADAEMSLSRHIDVLDRIICDANRSIETRYLASNAWHETVVILQLLDDQKSVSKSWTNESTGTEGSVYLSFQISTNDIGDDCRVLVTVTSALGLTVRARERLCYNAVLDDWILDEILDYGIYTQSGKTFILRDPI